MEKLDAKLVELLGLHIISLEEFLGLQRALRIASEAELIINQVESINGEKNERR
jgi:hypothetical protein